MARKKVRARLRLKNSLILLSIVVIVIGVLFISLVSTKTKISRNSQAAPITTSTYIPGQLIIRVKKGYSPSQKTIRSLTGWTDVTIKRLHKDIYLIKSLQLVRKFNNLSSSSRSRATAINPDSYTQSTISKLKSSSQILIAETDLVGRYDATPNDEYYIGQKPYLDNVGIEQAWDKTIGGSEVIIGVLDSGISAPGSTAVNPDLTNRMWVNIGEKNGTQGKDDDSNGYTDDLYGYHEEGLDPSDNLTHGIHVAGIIGAEYNNQKEIAGLCPQCRIMSLKSANSMNEGSLSNVLAAIGYAIKQKNKGVNIVAINHSYGYPASAFDADTLTLMKQVFTDSKNARIISVVSAGNQHLVTNQYPALFTADDLVFTIVGVTRDGLLAGFSNYGTKDTEVDFAAPGTDSGANGIISLKNTTGSVRLEGTSMSTPHVTGLIGLMLSLKQDLTYSQIKTILSSTAENLGSVQLPQYKGKLGFGRIHAERAISKLIADYNIVVQPTHTPPVSTPTLPIPTNTLAPSQKPSATRSPTYPLIMTNPNAGNTYPAPLRLPVGGRLSLVPTHVDIHIFNYPINTATPLATQRIVDFTFSNSEYHFGTWFLTNITTTGEYVVQIVPYGSGGALGNAVEIRFFVQNIPTNTPTPTPRRGLTPAPSGIFR